MSQQTFKDYINPHVLGRLDPKTIDEMYPYKDDKGRFRLSKTTQEMHKEVKLMSKTMQYELRNYFVSRFMDAVDEKYGYGMIELSDIYDFSVDYIEGNL